MNSKAESIGTTMDTLKLVVAAAIFVSALVAYYVFADASQLLRVLGVVAAGAASLFVASQTERGRQTLAFIHDAQIEIRKVVWPTVPETRHTTLIVLVMVVIAALFLWALDSFLGYLVRALMGTGS